MLCFDGLRWYCDQESYSTSLVLVYLPANLRYPRQQWFCYLHKFDMQWLPHLHWQSNRPRPNASLSTDVLYRNQPRHRRLTVQLKWLRLCLPSGLGRASASATVGEDSQSPTDDKEVPSTPHETSHLVQQHCSFQALLSLSLHNEDYGRLVHRVRFEHKESLYTKSMSRCTATIA